MMDRMQHTLREQEAMKKVLAAVELSGRSAEVTCEAGSGVISVGFILPSGKVSDLPFSITANYATVVPVEVLGMRLRSKGDTAMAHGEAFTSLLEKYTISTKGAYSKFKGTIERYNNWVQQALLSPNKPVMIFGRDYLYFSGDTLYRIDLVDTGEELSMTIIDPLAGTPVLPMPPGTFRSVHEAIRFILGKEHDKCHVNKITF